MPAAVRRSGTGREPGAEAAARTPPEHGGRSTVAPWARWLAVAAALAAVALIAFSLTRPEPAGFPPTAVARPFGGDDDASLLFTADASVEGRWVFFSFAEGAVVDGGAGGHWDLAFRRFHIIANGGAGFDGHAAIADLGATPFESARVPPPEALVETSAARDSSNAAIARWYRYGFTSHLLTPLDRTYGVRAADGRRHYALRILGYYCPGARPGCMTIRYRPLN